MYKLAPNKRIFGNNFLIQAAQNSLVSHLILKSRVWGLKDHYLIPQVLVQTRMINIWRGILSRNMFACIYVYTLLCTRLPSSIFFFFIYFAGMTFLLPVYLYCHTSQGLYLVYSFIISNAAQSVCQNIWGIL